MIEVNKEELRRLAEAATKGNWVYVQGGEEGSRGSYYPCISAEDGDVIGIEGFFSDIDRDEANAEFIAAANPAAILSLLDENKALLDQVAVLQSDANSWQSGYDKGREMGGKHRDSEVDQLRAENERICRELTAFRNNTSISGSQIEWIDQILSKEGNANS